MYPVGVYHVLYYTMDLRAIESPTIAGLIMSGAHLFASGIGSGKAFEVIMQLIKAF